MIHARIAEWPIHRFESGIRHSRNDLLAVEEPLEMRIDYKENGERRIDRLAITMRTPGADEELMAGFLFSEGIVSRREQIVSLEEGRSIGRDKPFSSTITATLAENATYHPSLHERRFIMTSSCGVCGKASLSIAPDVEMKRSKLPAIAPALIASLPERQRESQTVFSHTGGLHAASLFDSEGRLLKTFEDIGRHNAMDKLVGYGFNQGLLPFADGILLFSGRVGYELMQKAIMAGVTVVGAVGAPSSLAVQMAHANEITLAGFVRNARFNVYSGIHRLASDR